MTLVKRKRTTFGETADKIANDKYRCAFGYDERLNSEWFIELEGIERPLIYIGKTQGKKIFKFNEFNPNDSNAINNVMIIPQMLVYRYSKKSKRK